MSNPYAPDPADSPDAFAADDPFGPRWGWRPSTQPGRITAESCRTPPQPTTPRPPVWQPDIAPASSSTRPKVPKRPP